MSDGPLTPGSFIMLDTIPLWEQSGKPSRHPALIGDVRDDNDVMVIPITHARTLVVRYLCPLSRPRVPMGM